jgi:hypothetical protein
MEQTLNPELNGVHTVNQDMLTMGFELELLLSSRLSTSIQYTHQPPNRHVSISKVIALSHIQNKQAFRNQVQLPQERLH